MSHSVAPIMPKPISELESGSHLESVGETTSPTGLSDEEVLGEAVRLTDELVADGLMTKEDQEFLIHMLTPQSEGGAAAVGLSSPSAAIILGLLSFALERKEVVEVSKIDLANIIQDEKHASANKSVKEAWNAFGISVGTGVASLGLGLVAGKVLVKQSSNGTKIDPNTGTQIADDSTSWGSVSANTFLQMSQTLTEVYKASAQARQSRDSADVERLEVSLRTFESWLGELSSSTNSLNQG